MENENPNRKRTSSSSSESGGEAKRVNRVVQTKKKERKMEVRGGEQHLGQMIDKRSNDEYHHHGEESQVKLKT